MAGNKVVWAGHERREHDEECRERARALKEWVVDRICIATKGTKMKQAIMWSIMLIMLSASLGGAWKTISVAQDTANATSDQKAIDTQQSAEIKHNTEQLKAIIEFQGKMVDNQDKLADVIQDVQIKQTRVITILERIEAKVE